MNNIYSAYGDLNPEIIDRYYNKASSEDYNGFIERINPELSKRLGKTLEPIARSITIQVTDACNLCCSYCYQINKGHNKLSLETGKKFIDLLLTDDTTRNNYINKFNSDIVVIDFIGGEPLLEIDLIVQLSDYIIQRMIELDHPWLPYLQFSISTNGTLYFDERFQKYIKKYKGKISVNITVDGNKKLHDTCRLFADGSGSYDLAMKAVKHWIEFSGMNNPSTKLTIAPGNIDCLSEALISMLEEGFMHINENCVYEEGWTIEHAKKLYSELKIVADYIIDHDYECDHTMRIFTPSWYHPMSPEDDKNWCGGDGRMLAVDVHGDLFNCIRYMESSLGSDQKPLVIGNVDDGIGVTEDAMQNIACMQCITRKSQSTDECFNCPIAQGCGWCTAYNYQTFGTCNKRATYICDMHKAASLANVYYWNRVLEKHQKDDNDIKDSSRMKVKCPREWAVPIIGEEEYNSLLQLANQKEE